MSTKQINAVHSKITDQIVQAIEEGIDKFEMPWHGQAGLPSNSVTGKIYHGINTLSLWVAGQTNGYATSGWASYLQWQSLGGQVKKGEKGSTIVFYKRLDGEGEDDKTLDDDKEKVRMVIKHSNVFNKDQIEGLPDIEPDFKAQSEQATLDNVEAFITGLNSDVRYGSNRASYSPQLDCISMPDRTEFFDTKSSSAMESFYSVLLHEHIHWTRHQSRLNRNLSERYGKEEGYAMEELVAELGSAYLCAELGISTHPRADHASYISSWLKALKGDTKAIFAMASLAFKASQFLGEKYIENTV